MVGLVVPIHLEGGDSTSRPATRDFAASRLKSRSVNKGRSQIREVISFFCNNNLEKCGATKD